MRNLYLVTDNSFIGYDEEGIAVQSTVIVGVFSSKNKAIHALKGYNNGNLINYLNTFSITKYSLDVESIHI